MRWKTTAGIEPLEKRCDHKVLVQCEKLKRLSSHPLHEKLRQPTKNRLKRQSLNHQSKELSRAQGDLLDIPSEPLVAPNFRPDERASPQIIMSVPGIMSRDQLPAHLKALTQAMVEDRYPPSVWTHVYTDGSAEEAVRNGGSGVFTRFPDGSVSQLSVPAGKLCSNFRAEVQAISTAAEFLTECGKRLDHIVIFTDSISTLQALNSADPDQMIQHLQSSLDRLSALTQELTLQWVPAHVGVAGNEEADRLAKAGSQLPQPQHPATYMEMKTLLRSCFKTQKTHSNNRYQAHLDPIKRIDRWQQTIIFRLRTGHCGLNAHLKRIGISDTSLCACGQADQTPDHVLQKCPRFTQRRQQVWPDRVNLATKLWGTAEDLRRTAGFAASLPLKI